MCGMNDTSLICPPLVHALAGEGAAWEHLWIQNSSVTPLGQEELVEGSV